MKIDRSVPGRATVADWDPEPVLPLALEHCGQWRDCGRYGSCELIIADAGGQRYHFFFDKVLSRLCHGSDLERGDDAAFIVSGSRLERMLLEFLESQRCHAEFGELLGHRLDLAAAYAGRSQVSPVSHDTLDRRA
jgi:hypothetical protein